MKGRVVGTFTDDGMWCCSVSSNNLSTYDYEYVFSKRRNILSTERVQKFVYICIIHGTIRNISSGRKFTSAAAKPGSSLLNYLTNKMYSANCCLFQFSNYSDYLFIITDITEFHVLKTVIPNHYAMTNCNL